MCLNGAMNLILAPSPVLSPVLCEAVAEFLLARVANPHTRRLYWAALRRYANWLADQGVALLDARPLHLALYKDSLSRTLAPASITAELSGVRQLYSWLVERQLLVSSPAVHCRGPRRVVTAGKTPVLAADDIRKLLASLPGDSVVALRDRAMISLMLYSFLRVSAVVALRFAGAQEAQATGMLSVQEKGGQQRRIPLHPEALCALREFLHSAGLARDGNKALFPAAVRGKAGILGHRAMSRTEVYAMVRRRLQSAGISVMAGCHSFRATGITEFLASGGRIETAALLAGHASLRTTQLYDRRPRDAAMSELAMLSFG